MSLSVSWYHPIDPTSTLASTYKNGHSPDLSEKLYVCAAAGRGTCVCTSVMVCVCVVLCCVVRLLAFRCSPPPIVTDIDGDGRNGMLDLGVKV